MSRCTVTVTLPRTSAIVLLHLRATLALTLIITSGFQGIWHVKAAPEVAGQRHKTQRSCQLLNHTRNQGSRARAGYHKTRQGSKPGISATLACNAIVSAR